ncbi:hypothetical protein ACHAXR_005221, partial [Thalassiosira sp. AJA248-18]
GNDGSNGDVFLNDNNEVDWDFGDANNNGNNSNNKVAQSDCTILVGFLLPIPNYIAPAPPPGEEPPPALEEEVFDCELDPNDTNGIPNLTRKLQLSTNQKATMKQLMKDGDLIPGQSKFQLAGQNVIFDDGQLKVPPGWDVRTKVIRGNGNGGNAAIDDDDDDDEELIRKRKLFHENGHRQLNFGSHTGIKPILVVKVKAGGKQLSQSTQQISDDIFGTNGDPVNLKSQLYACSQNKLQVQVGVEAHELKYSAPGVLHVEISTSLSNSRSTIRNAVTSKVQQILGESLPGRYQQVMYVLEGCYSDCGWAAYAYINSWNSVYQSNYYRMVGVQVHELGHNFGLAHSGGLDGATYTDHTGLMGNPLYSDDVGKMCYNAAKNWQIGWYNDRRVKLYPRRSTFSDTTLTMIGIADYLNSDPNFPVVVKLETDTSDDYFIGFNRATGMNSQNDEADNLLTIVKTGANGVSYSQSWLQGYIGEGGTYNIAQYGIRITLCSIDKTSSPYWKARIGVGSASACDVTAPTSSPSFAPTINCDGGGLILGVDVVTDDYPAETNWTLTNACTGDIAEASPTFSDPGRNYRNDYCIPEGRYIFQINDSWGDGICCAYSQGSYSVKYDGNVVASGGQFGSSQNTTFGLSSCDPTKKPTLSPTNYPTTSPTKLPTKEPTSEPTNDPTNPQPTESPTTAPSKSP